MLMHMDALLHRRYSAWSCSFLMCCRQSATGPIHRHQDDRGDDTGLSAMLFWAFSAERLAFVGLAASNTVTVSGMVLLLFGVHSRRQQLQDGAG